MMGLKLPIASSGSRQTLQAIDDRKGFFGAVPVFPDLFDMG